MRELGLLLLVLAAVSAGGSRAESGCRTTGRNTGELAVCGDTRARDARTPQDAAIPAVPARPTPPVSLPPEGWTRGSKPVAPGDPESAPKAGRY